MTEKILSYEDVVKAIKLYNALPVAIVFRGLTGYGLVIDNNDQELIGKVDSAKAIWKPMYFAIVGGGKYGRKKLSAENIRSAIEEFQSNPLWALLKSTTGYGLKTNITGMVELVDAKKADSQITFEVSHYGGRSIVTELNVELGKLVAENIDWKSGFGYHNFRHCAAHSRSNVILSHFLQDSNENIETLEQVLHSMQGEAYRLGLMNTDGTLPKSGQSNSGKMIVFLKQELTGLLPDVQIDEQQGFQYNIRQDGVVEIQKSLSWNDRADENSFGNAFKAFRKECSRVLMMYCQPLTDNQRQKSGYPTGEVFGMPDIQSLVWQEGRKGGVIAFHPSASSHKDATFPADGWKPEIGKKCRCLCIRKGRGFTAYPAPLAYVKRFTDKDKQTAVKQVVKIAFDGREKIINEADIPLKNWDEYRERVSFSARLEEIDGTWWIIETITNYYEKFREVIISDGFDINNQPKTKISSEKVDTVSYLSEWRFRPKEIWIEPVDEIYSEERLAIVNPSEISCDWKIVALGYSPDSRTVRVFSEVGEWNKAPQFLRQRHLADYPLCRCQRSRYKKTETGKCSRCDNIKKLDEKNGLDDKKLLEFVGSLEIELQEMEILEDVIEENHGNLLGAILNLIDAVHGGEDITSGDAWLWCHKFSVYETLEILFGFEVMGQGEEVITFQDKEGRIWESYLEDGPPEIRLKL